MQPDREVLARRLELIDLVGLHSDHLGELHAMIEEPGVGTYWRTRGAPVPRSEWEEFLVTESSHQIVARARADGSIVGYAELIDYSPPDRHASFTVFTHPYYWGRGHPVELVAGYLALIFEALELDKIYAVLHDDVVRRQSSLHRFFDTEGVLRRHINIDGFWGDVHILSVSRPAFLEHRNGPVLNRVLG